MGRKAYKGVLSLEGVSKTFVAQLAQPDLYQNLWVTGYEVVSGFVIALVASLFQPPFDAAYKCHVYGSRVFAAGNR